MNSCRDTTSFTDFPLDPARNPPFLDHHHALQYLREYAEFFDLERHVRLNTRVIKAEPLGDGQWKVRHQTKGEEPVEATYDAVFACSGTKGFLNDPAFPGRESYEGDYSHSHTYRTPNRYEGKSVALIGLGASAVDIACELVPACKEVHVITRRGAWTVPRFIFGQPAEAYDSEWARSSLALFKSDFH